jgi:uncharacterized membrane protein required for colicin V production
VNWLEIVILVVIVVMAVIGHQRGFIRMIVGLLAMVLALIGTAFVAPMLSDYINEQTGLRQKIAGEISTYLEEQIGEKLEQSSAAAQKEAIEKLSLPDNVKEALQKNNTADMYKKLGVSSFAAYVSNYVASAGISALSYLIVFLVLYIGLRVVFMLLNIVALLPFLKGINKLAGAALGVLQAVVYIWVFFAVATAAMSTSWGMEVLVLIGQSRFLTFLYHYNVILSAILS